METVTENREFPIYTQRIRKTKLNALELGSCTNINYEEFVSTHYSYFSSSIICCPEES